MNRMTFKLLLILLVSCFAFQSHAIFNMLDRNQGCPSSATNNHIVVSFEGLGNLGVSKAAISNRYKQSYGYSNMNLSRHGGPAALNCIMKLKQENPALKVSLVGHSCGGVTAARVANNLGTNGVAVENVLTVDPRCHHSMTACADNKSHAAFRKGPNIKNWVNFYQCGHGLAGQQVSGTENCRVGHRHGTMPANGMVQTVAARMLSGRNPGVRGRCPVINKPVRSGIADFLPQPRNNNMSTRNNRGFNLANVFRIRNRNASPAPRARVRRRARRSRWADHPKANRPARCAGPGGRHYDCTWAEASAINYSEDMSR